MGTRLAQLGFGLLLLTAHAVAQFTTQERLAVLETLSIGNMTEADLRWERRIVNDPWRLPLIDLAIDRPIDAADQVMTIAGQVSRSSVAQVVDVFDLGRTKSPPGDPSKPRQAPWPGPSGLREPTVMIMEAVRVATAQVRSATQDLSPEQRRGLIESLPVLMAEDYDPKFDFVRQRPMEFDAAMSLLQSVDLEAIRRAAAELAKSVDKALPSLRAFKGDLPRPLVWSYVGISLRISGRGSDVHGTEPAIVEIDLGGDDRWIGRHGAGVGYASVVLDLGGNDVYQVPDASLGCGLLGIGLGRDDGGNDTYHTRSLAIGAGLAGVGTWVDAGGDDDYRSLSLSQGFGAFGLGAFIEVAGDDRYALRLFGQGAARTFGFGVLNDRNGNDTYQAGGGLLNSPMFDDVHYSFAQGFGMGFRDEAGGVSGGVGLLADSSGHDTYTAETYAQGASYWFGLGALVDGGGPDAYAAHHYAQASAMHATAAFLIDLGGDDGYLTRYGAAHAIGHDYGVALLFDRAGNDVYASRDSNPGLGNANGLGIFIDAAGDDRYQGPVARGNAARGTGSLGLFVDLAGLDRYAEGLADGQARSSGTWSVAYDRENPPTATPRTGRLGPPTPGSQPSPGPAALSGLYAQASQWNVGVARESVDQALNRLIGVGMPAVEWMLAERLETAERLQIRAFVTVLREVGPEAREALLARAREGSQAERRNALTIAVEGGFTELTPLVTLCLAQPALRMAAVRAAGTLAASEAVPRLMEWALQPDALGLAALVSLAQIGDSRALPLAETLVTSPVLPTRKAALTLIAKHPDAAIARARRLLNEGDGRAQRIGLELLAAVGSPAALEGLGVALEDPDPGLRIQALQGLAGRCPPTIRNRFLALRTDPDPLVRAVALRVEPDR